MRQQEIGWTAIVIAALFMWIGQLFLVSPTVRSDSLGELLFLLTIFFPLLFKFDNKSLGFSIIFGICSFFAKAYFFLGVLIIGSYLFLFISKRRALLYLTCSGFALISAVFITNHYLETYLANTVLNLFTGRLSGNYFHLIKQCIKFFKDYWGLLIIGSEIILLRINSLKKFNNIKVNLNRLSLPMLSAKLNLVFYALLVTTLLVLLLLGTNSGTFQSYFYQLITPFFVILSLSYFDKQKSYKKLTLAVAIITLTTNTYMNLNIDFQSFYTPDWGKLESRISAAKLILNSPLDVSILIKEGKPIAMSGFTQYYFIYPTKLLFLSQNTIEKMKVEGSKYIDNIANRIRNKNYDFLETIQNDGYEIFLLGESTKPPLSDLRFISNYYHMVETLYIPMPHSYENWKIGIWEPN